MSELQLLGFALLLMGCCALIAGLLVAMVEILTIALPSLLRMVNDLRLRLTWKLAWLCRSGDPKATNHIWSNSTDPEEAA